MGRREAYGARVYVCMTGDRGRCRNAGEDDPLLGLARLIAAVARFVALRAADLAIRGQRLAQPRQYGIESALPPGRTGSSSQVFISAEGGPLTEHRIRFQLT